MIAVTSCRLTTAVLTSSLFAGINGSAANEAELPQRIFWQKYSFPSLKKPVMHGDGRRGEEVEWEP